MSRSLQFTVIGFLLVKEIWFNPIIKSKIKSIVTKTAPNSLPPKSIFPGRFKFSCYTASKKNPLMTKKDFSSEIRVKQLCTFCKDTFSLRVRAFLRKCWGREGRVEEIPHLSRVKLGENRDK